MGATITKKSYDVKIREECTLQKFYRIHQPIRGDAEELFSNNNTIANKFYKVQFANVCNSGYYTEYRKGDSIAYSGTMIEPVISLQR